MPRLQVELEPVRSEAARQCLTHYHAELTARFENGFDTSLGNSLEADDVTPPYGYFVIARIDGMPIGCGALKLLEPGIGEVKRVWTSSAARGQGVARKVMDKLEAIARELGLAAVRIDTNRTLAEARALYLKLGYREIARYNDNPFAHHWFEKGL